MSLLRPKEEGGSPDLEGLDRYIVIDLDADKSDPEAMICHSAGVLELPISLTDPLLCAAHAAITLNQCLDTMVCKRVGTRSSLRDTLSVARTHSPVSHVCNSVPPYS